MIKNKKNAMQIFAFITVSLWALGYVMTRIAVVFFTSESLSFLRYLIASVSLIAFAFIKKMQLPKLMDVPLFIFGGAIGFAVYVWLINEGSRTLTASAVSFIISSCPIITALLARFILKERIGVLGWVSILCAFSGISVITYFNGGFVFDSGIIWVCAATVLISVYNIFQRKLLLRYSPLEITTYCIVAGALLLSVFAPKSFSEIINAPFIGIVSVVILGVFSAGLAYLLWACALSKADKTSEVTNYMFITPILTTFLGFVLIRELPHFSIYIGGVLVLAGVILINRRSIKTLNN
jgi:drug/metabolite transporter (DMT)-like permease